MALSRVIALLLLLVLPTLRVEAQPVVTAGDVASYNSLTPAQVSYIASKRILVVGRSVGAILFGAMNGTSGKECLSGPYATAKNSCKRYLHVIPAYNNQPETWSVTVPIGNFTFYGWPGIAPEIPCGMPSGSWTEKLNCFSTYVNAHASEFDIVLLLPSYLDADNGPQYIASMQALQSAHPSLTVVVATVSRARPGNPNFAAFDAAVNGSSFPIFDVADILSRDQTGAIWYDSRDGVPFTTSSCSENYPDDGVSILGIAPHYTRECEAGHPGNPDVGKIRAVKAFWVLMASF